MVLGHITAQAPAPATSPPLYSPGTKDTQHLQEVVSPTTGLY